VGVVSSPSHEGSTTDASNSKLTTFDMGSTKKVKVTTAVAAAGITFNFGMSTMGRERVQELEGLLYFVKDGTRSLGPEIVPEPQPNEVMVFEDLFTIELHKPPHSLLTDILRRFHVQLHQLTPNAIVQISKFI
jgi:hypothetical protein